MSYEEAEVGMQGIVLHAIILTALATAPTAPLPSEAKAITLGSAYTILNGPWQFHAGDDPSWSNPSFDDTGWEQVDLTAPTGAHDADVGLSGYVRGWGGRGHSGMSGYGWYRMHLQVASSVAQPLAIAGPPAVDSAYQIFWNGHLLGGLGSFVSANPLVFSVQPKIFPLGAAPAASISTNVLAVRVWMGPWDLADPQGGGIRIAPTFGTDDAVKNVYREEWIETLRGYVVEVVEALGFACACLCAWLLARLDASPRRYRWLYVALLLTGAYRLNQAIFFWGQFESVPAFELISPGILYPLGLVAWTMAWAYLAGWANAVWLKAVTIVTPLYVASTLIEFGVLYRASHPTLSTVAHLVMMGCRYFYMVSTCWLAIVLLRPQQHRRWLLAAMLILVSVGQFAPELSQIGVPGIWFPFETGVSRGQFAYAFFFIAGAVFFYWRLMNVAGDFRRRAMISIYKTECRSTIEGGES